MNWTAVTTDNLNASSVSGKIAIIRSIATGKTMPDPAPAAIGNITKELRAVIGFSGKYSLDQDTTKIPNGLLDLAVKKIVRDMSKAVSLPLSKDEEADERTYESRLDKIRLGEWPIEPADLPVTTPSVQESTTLPNIRPRCRSFNAGCA